MSSPLPGARLIMWCAQKPSDRPSSCLCITEKTSQGKPLTKHQLSPWFCETIIQAYVAAEKDLSHDVGTHSTRGVSSSAALFNGIAVEDIYAAALCP